MTARRRAIEGRMLRELGMTTEASERLIAHNKAQTDWHGWCRVCRTHFTGSVAELGGPCPHCGSGADHGTAAR